MSTFDNQSMSIGCVGKLGHLFGLLRHYLLTKMALTTNYTNMTLYSHRTTAYIHMCRWRPRTKQTDEGIPREAELKVKLSY